MLVGHTGSVNSVAWHADGKLALSGSHDRTVRVWEVESGKCERVLKAHTDSVNSVAWHANGKHALSGSDDRTVRVWEVESGKCERVLEGHTGSIMSVAWRGDGKLALSGSGDKTVRVWEVESGKCERVLVGHTGGINNVAWHADGKLARSGAFNGVWHSWDLSELLIESPQQKILTETRKNSPSITLIESATVVQQIQYTNAKVLLVGDSGVGKTGLANRLARDHFEETESTDGAWATHWKLQHNANKDGVEREIWLWDFAGQVDYRLVHQLYMDETAAAVLVFNPQQENPFEGLGQWDRDLQKAARKPFAKLLVAGRTDRGGLVVSQANMENFMRERSFTSSLQLTSAKTREGCESLREAIITAIDWQNIPETTSPVLYHRLKQEILKLRDSGLVLIRLSELKQRMELTLAGELFELKELETVIGLLAGPGMIQRVVFGGFILLRPEMLSRYAAAVVRKVRKHPQELGCIREDEMLAGKLDYQDFERLSAEDEAVILRTLHETFISRAWCLRQPSDGTALLVFPSYFRRERPDLPNHPNVLVTYRFQGPIDEVYATLVVRLHYTEAFNADQLWKDAADFKTQTNQKLGLKLTRENEGTARLDIYFNPDVDENSQLVFLRYIHNHLNDLSQYVVRLRHYCCTNKKCDALDQPFTDQPKIDKALASGKGKIFCSDCGKPILLRDVIEQKFDTFVIHEQVRKEEEISKQVIDNESRELILVGHAFTITAEAGQIYRGYTNSDYGIDGEIEFKDDALRASGKRLYMQLKSGDSYLTTRKRDGAEIFYIGKEHQQWVQYWQKQAYPVMLVIRNSDGEIRWMDVAEYLKRESNNGKKPVTQIIFQGERFDVMSVRRWRDKILAQV